MTLYSNYTGSAVWIHSISWQCTDAEALRHRRPWRVTFSVFLMPQNTFHIDTQPYTIHRHTHSTQTHIVIHLSIGEMKKTKKNSVLYRRYKTLDKGGWEWNMMWLDTKIAAAAAAHKTESWAWHHRFSIIFVHAIWHFPSNAMVRSPKKNGDIHQGKCIKSTTHSQ